MSLDEIMSMVGIFLMFLSASILLYFSWVKSRQSGPNNAALGSVKLNRGGLKFCAVYILYAAVLIILAYFTHDPKGQFVIVSFAWAPAGVTFGVLHLFPVMYQHPWTNTPYFLFPASLLIVYVIGWLISTANRKLFYPRRFPTTRFVLYLALIPIITEILLIVLYVIRYSFNPPQPLSYSFWLAYTQFFVPALFSATADWMLRSGKWPRLGTIAGVGFVSTFLTFYGLFARAWQWQMLLPGFSVAIASLVCCWLLDQLNKEHSGNSGPIIPDTSKLTSET